MISGRSDEGFDPDGAPRYGDPAPSLWLVHAAELFETATWGMRGGRRTVRR